MVTRPADKKEYKKKHQPNPTQPNPTQHTPTFIEYLPNCIVIIVFWVLGEIYFSLWPDTPIAASCNPPRLSSPFLPSLSPYYDTSRVLSYYRRQSSRITKPPNGTVPFDPSTQENNDKKSRNPRLPNPPPPSHPALPSKERGERKMKKGEVQTSGWVGQASDYLNLLTLPARTSTRLCSTRSC